ncbi:unnamed protein product, partial [Meganyctiphanes norvegica]
MQKFKFFPFLIHSTTAAAGRLQHISQCKQIMTSKTWNLFWGSSFVRAPLQNGIGRYVPQLQRITLKFCKSTGSSQGAREYIEKELIHFARANPGVVVYLKPRRHKQPQIVAEYLHGEKDHRLLKNMKSEEIAGWMSYMNTKSGYPTTRLRKYQHTDHPSIQGPWNQTTHRDPRLNVTEFPCVSL